MSTDVRKKPNFVAGVQVNGNDVDLPTLVSDVAGLDSDVDGLNTDILTKAEKVWVDKGHYVPERSLKQWKQCKTPVIAWFGDSTVNGDVGGFDLTGGGAGSCTELLGLMIVGFGPYIGPGFYGMWRDEWVYTAGGAAFAVASPTTDVWDVGPFISARRSTGSNTTLATFAIPRTIDPQYADIVFWDDTATATANWSYATSVDGTTFTAYTNSVQHWTTGNPMVSRLRFAVPAGTTHIRIKAGNAAGTSKQVTLLGMILYTADPGVATGPQVHNIGASADFISTLVRANSVGQPLRTVWSLQPTLAVIGPFTNDGTSGTIFEDSLKVLIQGLRSRTVYDVVTNSTTTITSETANFSAQDVGKSVHGSGLGSGLNFIASVTNATTAVLATAATSSLNPVPNVVIAPNRTKIGTDLVKTSGSRVVNAATGNFQQSDVGKWITGTGIPAFTYVQRVVSSTQLILNANATASSTDAYSIGDQYIYANRIYEADPDILIVGQFHQAPTVDLADVVTTNGQATISAPAGTFRKQHVSRGITGTGIPGLAKILSVQSDTNATISANATASGTIVATLIGRVPSDEDALRAECKAVARGFISDDGTSVDGSSDYTSATANFVAEDIGKRVRGYGIQDYTYIHDVTDSTTIVLSRPAIGDGTGEFVMEGYAYLDMGEVWYDGDTNAEVGLLNDNYHETQLGHRELANRVLSLLEKYS